MTFTYTSVPAGPKLAQALKKLEHAVQQEQLRQLSVQAYTMWMILAPARAFRN